MMKQSLDNIKAAARMNIFGIGPLLIFAGGISTSLVIGAQFQYGYALSLGNSFRPYFLVIGLLLGIIGIYFCFTSFFLVRRGFLSHKLVTSGVYRYSRHPLYAAFIVFLVPSAAFIFDNLLVLIATLVMFLVFKQKISKEEEYLEKEFGDEYQRYIKQVSQLIPFIKF